MTKDELKKEAEEYANTHGTTVMGFEENLDCTDFVIETYLASAEPREKRIEELEKENAELKNQLNKVCGIKGCMQLTKAKELLKRCYDNYFCLEPLRSEIALFLSEVEK